MIGSSPRSHESRVAVAEKAAEIANRVYPEKHWTATPVDPISLGHELGHAFYMYSNARNYGTTAQLDAAAEHLYRTWVSLPILEEAEWTDEERESQRVQAPDKDGQT